MLLLLLLLLRKVGRENSLTFSSSSSSSCPPPNSKSSGRYAIVFFLLLHLSKTAEAVQLLHNNDGDKENTTYLFSYSIRTNIDDGASTCTIPL